MERRDIILNFVGGMVKKKRNRVIIEVGDIKEEINIKYVNSLIISGKVAITTDVIKLLISNNIPIIITTPFGKPIAIINSYDIGGSAINRYFQYKIYETASAGEFAKELIKSKIHNQISNLKYYAKNRKPYKEEEFKILYSMSEKIKNLLNSLENIHGKPDDIRENLLNIEAKAAEIYWNGIKEITKQYGFEGRVKEMPTDPINILLNIFYNILSIEIWKDCIYFSIDPYFGYIHKLRPGKLSFVFDFMEQFRPLIDRFVISNIKKYDINKIKTFDYKYINKIKLDFYDYLNKKISYQNKKLRIRYIFWIKCREFVGFLRNENKYKGFYIYW